MLTHGGSDGGARGLVRFREAFVNRYQIIIYWSNEDELFIAEVPELKGCTAHGDTQESALANAKEAIGHWIEVAREFGEPVPEPKGLT